MRFRAAILLLLLAGALGCLRRAERCAICDRDIHPSVRASLILDDGRTIHACCPRCALRYEEADHPVRAMTVTDYPSRSSLPAGRAWLVEGSDEIPCMKHPPIEPETRTPLHVCYDRCMPSLIAFRDEAAARAFMAEHGGTLHDPGSYPGIPAVAR
jgi:hypothetical protein